MEGHALEYDASTFGDEQTDRLLGTRKEVHLTTPSPRLSNASSLGKMPSPREDGTFLHRRVLSTHHLVALIFFNVSGGPFGAEGVIQAAGPLFALLGFFLVPWVWSFPIAMMTAEMSSTFPHDGGYTVWVRNVFGDFWGFQMGWWNWLSGVVDNAVYPVLVIEYFLQLFGDDVGELTTFESWLVKAGITCVLTFVNLRGLEIVGIWSVVVNTIVILPFLVMCLWGIKEVDPSVWVERPPASINWTDFINLLLWNLNSWDAVSTFAGEVKEPGRTYPRAMLWAMLLIISTYFFPLMIGVGISPDLSLWEDGYFTKLSSDICGPWMGYIMLLAAALSCGSQFTAELATDSYQLAGMSEQGLVPAIFSLRLPKWDTPGVATLVSFVCIMFLITFPFDIIVQIENIVYSIALILECAAAITLRVKRPDLHRPFKVRCGIKGFIALLIIPSGFCVLTVVVADPLSLLVSGISIVFGFAMCWALQQSRKRGWFAFVMQSPNHDAPNVVVVDEEWDNHERAT